MESDLALALAVLRVIRGWTQEELANASGVRASSISDYASVCSRPRPALGAEMGKEKAFRGRSWELSVRCGVEQAAADSARAVARLVRLLFLPLTPTGGGESAGVGPQQGLAVIHAAVAERLLAATAPRRDVQEVREQHGD
jgi:hypothetical protein